MSRIRIWLVFSSRGLPLDSFLGRILGTRHKWIADIVGIPLEEFIPRGVSEARESCAATDDPFSDHVPDPHLAGEILPRKESRGTPREESANHSTTQMVVVYLVRHAEAEHNTARDSSMRDPHLTAQGKQQALKLRDHFDDVSVQHVFASPLLRARYTAAVVFRMYPTCFVALREQRAAHKPWHFVPGEELFNETDEELASRVYWMLVYLRGLEGTVAIVSHSRTIREMLRQTVGVAQDDKWLGNCEFVKSEI